MYQEIKDNNKLLIKLFIGTILVFLPVIIGIGILFITNNLFLNKSLFIFIYNLIIIIYIIIILTLIIVLFSKFKNKINFLYIKWIKISLKIIYPLIYISSFLFNIDKDIIRGEFANINNHIISKGRISVKPEDVLLLLPHCIQWSECPHKLTNNIKNCKRCGKCKLKELIDISLKYRVQISIVSGGTMARNIIKRLCPKAIVAVACERDLSSGIKDIKLIPVLGIVNERPEGPCCNTRVNLAKVEEAIVYFINGGDF